MFFSSITRMGIDTLFSWFRPAKKHGENLPYEDGKDCCAAGSGENDSGELETIASDYMREEAFLAAAACYGISPSDVTVSEDLPLQESPFDDDYYSTLEKERYEHPKPSLKQAHGLSWSIKWQKGGLLGQGSFGKSPRFFVKNKFHRLGQLRNIPFAYHLLLVPLKNNGYGCIIHTPLVHLGLNLDNGELLAVKQVVLEGEDLANNREVQALQQEIVVLRTLEHENIVRYMGCSVEGSTLNIFLEYVPGGSIASIIRRFGNINENLIRLYTKQILTGLEYLHSRQIIHRDIKGANILVDNKGVIKLSDFGASKELEGLVSQSGSGCKSLKGTVYWMAPEVIKQAGYGRQADIWSLGCTVVEMATGKPPWSDHFKDQVPALYNIAISNDTPPIPEFLSDQCKAFLMQCFRRNPLARPNAKRLLRHSWLNGSPLASPLIVPLSPFPQTDLLSATSNTPAPAASGPPDAQALDQTENSEIPLFLPNEKFKKGPASPGPLRRQTHMAGSGARFHPTASPPTTPSLSPTFIRRATGQPASSGMMLGSDRGSRVRSYSDPIEEEVTGKSLTRQQLVDLELSPDVPGLVQNVEWDFFT